MIDIESYSVEAYLKATGVDEFARSFKNASDSVGQVDKSTQKASSSVKTMIKTIAGVAAAVGVFNTLRKAVDGAVSRYDTLNNFPKVMEQMGFSAQKSEKAIDRLSDGIQGLPTTLDDVAGTAQRIATMTGDLDGAVETTLALNNAFIASGSDAAGASRGLQQYVEMLSRGEVDLTAWRTLQETMGVALNDTAKAFGFAGSSAQNDLYDALKEGHVTFDEFNAKLIELSNETGGFSDRALTASGGIRTAFSNMNTSVVRGVTNIISAIDDALSKTRLKSIQNIIESVGRSSFATLDAISKAVGPAISALAFLYNVIEPLLPLIIGLAVGFGTFFAITSLASIMSIAGGFAILKGALDTVAIAAMYAWSAMKAHPFVAVISIITGLIAMIVYLWKTNETFRDIVTSAWESIQNAVSATTDVFKSAIDSVDEFLKALPPGVVNAFNKAIEVTSSISRSFADLIVLAAQGVGTFLDSLATGTVNAFNSSIEWLGDTADKVSGFFSNLKESLSIKDVISNVIGPLTLVSTLFLGLASPIGWLIKGFTLLATQTSVFSDALAVLGGDMSIGEFANNLAEGISEVITYMAESSAEMITKGAEMITGFIQGMADKLPEIVQIGTEAITSFIEGLSTSLGEILPIGVAVITSFVESIAQTIPVIANTGVEVLTTLIEAITTSLPLIIGVGVQIITTLIESIAMLIPMLVETGVMILVTLIETIVSVLPMLIEVGMQIINTLIQTIVIMLPLIIEVAIQLIMTIIETILTLIPTLIETFILIVQTLIDTFILMLPIIIETVLTILMTIITVIIENLPLIIEAGIQILTALIDGIVTILPVLIESILMIITELLNVLIESLPMIIDAGIQILMALIDGIVSILPVLITTGINLIVSLVGVIISLLPQLLNAGIQILLALIKGIVSIIPTLLSAGINLIVQLVSAIIGMIPQLLSAGKDLILALIDGALSLVGNVLTAGKDLVTSLISGITGLFGNVLSTGKDLATNALDGVKGKAKDFLSAGKNIVGSIADGIKSNVSKVTSAISNVTSKIRDFLPFSPAKDGALRDIMDIQLVQSIAQAIEKGERVAVQAMAGVSKAIFGEVPEVANIDIAGQVANSSAKINTSIDHDVNRNDSNLENILRQALNRDQVIVMDTGALVGQTADRYNQTFGNNAQTAERWGE